MIATRTPIKGFTFSSIEHSNVRILYNMKGFLLLSGVLLLQAIHQSEGQEYDTGGLVYDTAPGHEYDSYGDPTRYQLGKCQIDPRRPVTYLPHPYDCSQFFVCLSGNLLPLACSGGLHFSSYSQQCEYPSIAGCRLPGIPGSSQEDSRGSSMEGSKGSSHESSKSGSKEGSKSKSKASSKSGSKEGSKSKSKSSSKSGSKEGSKSKSKASSKSGSKEGSKSKSKASSKSGSKEGSKSKSKSKSQHSEGKSKGSSKAKSSGSKEGSHGSSEGSVREHSSEETERFDHIGQCPESDEDEGYLILLPHRYDCRKFFVCNDGSPVLKECAPGRLFNCKRLMCDYPEYAVCA